MCKDLKVAHYPTTLKVECYELFAGPRDDESEEYDDFGFTKEDEIDSVEGKRVDHAIARNVIGNFQESIKSRMKVLFTFSID